MRIGITGHRRLPDGVAEQVRRALRAELAGLAERAGLGLVGVSCLADGPDAWFADEVLDRGGRLEAVVPAVGYREELPEGFRPEYDRLLRQAGEEHHTGLDAFDPKARMVAGEVLVGLVDQLIAVWDGNPARGYGGTADVATYALRTGLPVRVVWPEGARRA